MGLKNPGQIPYNQLKQEKLSDRQKKTACKIRHLIHFFFIFQTVTLLFTISVIVVLLNMITLTGSLQSGDVHLL